MEIFQSKEGASGWTTVGVGAVAAVPGNVKHALRNISSLPGTIVLVTTSKMSEFFGEVSKPFDPKRRPAPPTPEEMKTSAQTHRARVCSLLTRASDTTLRLLDSSERPRRGGGRDC
jgi:hypothetical protein